MSQGSTSDLNGLVDVQVYDRDQFEADVMTKVDQLMTEQDAARRRERDVKELLAAVKRLKEIKFKWERGRRNLEALVDTGVNRRKSLSLLNEQERLEEEGDELEQKQVPFVYIVLTYCLRLHSRLAI